MDLWHGHATPSPARRSTSAGTASSTTSSSTSSKANRRRVPTSGDHSRRRSGQRHRRGRRGRPHRDPLRPPWTIGRRRSPSGRASKQEYVRRTAFGYDEVVLAGAQDKDLYDQPRRSTPRASDGHRPDRARPSTVRTSRRGSATSDRRTQSPGAAASSIYGPGPRTRRPLAYTGRLDRSAGRRSRLPGRLRPPIARHPEPRRTPCSGGDEVPATWSADRGHHPRPRHRRDERLPGSGRSTSDTSRSTPECTASRSTARRVEDHQNDRLRLLPDPRPLPADDGGTTSWPPSSPDRPDPHTSAASG